MGSAWAHALIATAGFQSDKEPHGPGSPIWMRPGQTTYDRAAEATAKRFAACAGQLIKHNFDTRKAGTLDDGTRCKFTPLGVPFDTAPPRPRTTP